MREAGKEGAMAGLWGLAPPPGPADLLPGDSPVNVCGYCQSAGVGQGGQMGPTPESVKRSLTNVRPSPEAIGHIEAIREEAKSLVDIIFEFVPECRERSLALTHLEETVMWAVKGVCLNDPEAREIPIGEA